MIVLNASAAFVWTCCDGSRDLEQIARELGEALGSAVPAAEDLLRDVRAAVQDFERQDLLEKDP